MHLVQTRRTVNRLRGDRARAIERPSRTARPAPPRCARLPALSVPQHARAHRVERRRGDQRESLTQGCVAGDALAPSARVHIALGPLLVNGEEGGRFEGNESEGGHEGLGERKIRIGSPIIGDMVKTSVHHPKNASAERGVRPLGATCAMGIPALKTAKRTRERAIVASICTKRQPGCRVHDWALWLAGNCCEAPLRFPISSAT